MRPQILATFAGACLAVAVIGPVEPRAALADPIELPTHRTDTARTRIRWDDDLPAALKVARQENRPVFVTLRCLPCKTCSEFDKDVLEGGPDLDPLFRQFITVRLISA